MSLLVLRAEDEIPKHLSGQKLEVGRDVEVESGRNSRRPEMGLVRPLDSGRVAAAPVDDLEISEILSVI